MKKKFPGLKVGDFLYKVVDREICRYVIIYKFENDGACITRADYSDLEIHNLGTHGDAFDIVVPVTEADESYFRSPEEAVQIKKLEYESILGQLDLLINDLEEDSPKRPSKRKG